MTVVMKKFTTHLSRKPKPNRKPGFFLQNLPKPTDRKHFETVTTLIILIHPAIWPQQIWAENWGDGLCPFEGRVGSSSNTMWPGPRPTSVPSCILIHLTVWPQYINVTDSTDRQDRQTVYINVRFANHYLSGFLDNFKLIWVDFGSFR